MALKDIIYIIITKCVATISGTTLIWLAVLKWGPHDTKKYRIQMSPFLCFLLFFLKVEHRISVLQSRGLINKTAENGMRKNHFKNLIY